MKKYLFILIMLAALVLAGCSGSPAENSAEDDLTPLTVCLDWTPNINHAGIYTALANGYFAEEGLDVTITQPADNYALQLVAAGQAEIGVSYQEEVTFARTEDIPVVSIAAVLQHNTSGFAAPADKGIRSLADLSGKTYGGWGGQVEDALLAYLAEEYDYAQPVKNINIGSSDFFAATESGEIDFSWIFFGVTGVEAELRGVELDSFWIKDIDPALDYYTPVLVAEESWLADNGDIAARFLTAAAKGYEFTAENPQEAADILCEQVPELDAELVHAGIEWLADYYIAEAPYWGYQNAEIWQGFSKWLIDRGLLDAAFDSAAAFTNDYLPQ